MPDALAEHQGLLIGATAVSVAMLVAFAVAVPLVVARLPDDWLLPDRERAGVRRHPILHAALVIGRNLVGWAALLAGVAMLVLPGQGLLTILFGLALVDLPGKHLLVARVVAMPGVWRAVTWLRERAGRPPLRLPPDVDRPAT